MDDDLRALEQRFRRTPSPDVRLAFCRALDQVGRRDEAHVLLAGDPFAPGVREVLAERPCWSQSDGGPGRTRWLDVAPVERAPGVRWQVEVGVDATVGDLLPTPWGIVASVLEGHRHEARVLDPDDGAVRHRVQDVLGVLGVDAGVLLLVVQGAGPAARTLAAIDLQDGRSLWRRDLGANPTPGLARGVLLLGATSGEDGAPPVTLLPLPDPRVAPELPVTWREAHVSAITSRRVYGLERRRGGGGSWVLDLETGTVSAAWSWAPGRLVADDEGAVVTRGPERGVSLHAPGGELHWRNTDSPVASATHALLTPEHVVPQLLAAQAPFVLRRATGEQVGHAMYAWSVSAAREWMFLCARPHLEGCRLDGADSFRVHSIDLDEVRPAWGRRLYGVLADGGGLVCLEQPA